MQNQDPLNPMDNAQVTSQMAQINTVSGIDKLNSTVQGLNAQFAQMQALQGASLVGHDVIVDGNRLVADDDGVGQGGFELASQADHVKVEILDASGRVIDTADLGARWPAAATASTGRPLPASTRQRPRAFASPPTCGATAVNAATCMRDRVDAVSTGANGLTLELRNAGPVAYDQVKVFD